MDERYWVTRTPEEVSEEACRRMKEGKSTGTVSKRLMQKALSMYYGVSAEGSSSYMSRGGQFGEQVRMHVNLLRFYVQTMLSMILGDRITFLVTARKNTADAVRKAALFTKGLNYLSQTLKLDSVARKYAELGLLTGKSYLEVIWSAYGGDEVQGGSAYAQSGDIRLSVYTPMEVTEDAGALSDADVQWRVVRNLCNRFDYLAMYGQDLDTYNKLLSVPRAEPVWVIPRAGSLYYEEETINHYTLYHKRCPAVPDGYKLPFLAADFPLAEGGLPYSRIPIIPFMPSDMHGSVLGYTSVFDFMGPADAINTLLGIALTTHKILGGNNVAVYKGSGLTPPQMVNGMNWFEVTPGMEPKPIQLGILDPSLLEHAQSWMSVLQQLSGMNDAALGKVGRETSGAALAQLDAKALQFTSGAQSAYTIALQEAATLMCEIFANRLLGSKYEGLLGPDALAWAQSVPPAELADLSDVEITFVSPQSGTPAMRLEEARLMLEQGLLKSPQQFFELRDTGTLDPVLEGPRKHSMLIKDENELLRQGINPPVLVTDLHLEHIQEHRSVLDDPETRKDPNVVNAVYEHIFGQNPAAPGHITMQQELAMMPDLAAALGMDPNMLGMVQQQVVAQQRGAPDQPNPDMPAQQEAPGAAPVQE